MAHLAETFDKGTHVYCDRYISPALISLNFSSQEKCMRHVHGVSLCPAEATRIAVCVHSTVSWCTWTLRPLAGVVCWTDRTHMLIYFHGFFFGLLQDLLFYFCVRIKVYLENFTSWQYVIGTIMKHRVPAALNKLVPDKQLQKHVMLQWDKTVRWLW